MPRKSDETAEEILSLQPEKPAEKKAEPGDELLLRFDKSELKVAADGDIGYQFGLRDGKGKPLRNVNGVQTDGLRAYVFPHVSDVTQFAARGYRQEKYTTDGIRPAGVTPDGERIGKPITVFDHHCMSVEVGEWRRQKLSDLATGAAMRAGLIAEAEAPIRIDYPAMAGA